MFLTNEVSRRFLDAALGFAAGVMIAASFWSLLAPPTTLAEEMGCLPWVPALVGFLLGGSALWGADRLLPHLHPFAQLSEVEGIPTSWHRSVLLVLWRSPCTTSPRGSPSASPSGPWQPAMRPRRYRRRWPLAIGIGLQNWPEGMAVAVPLRREGISRGRSFFFGQLSAAVEPIAGVVGAGAVLVMRPILPFALAFAAGAMILVVVEEVVPESQSGPIPTRRRWALSSASPS